MLNNSFLHFLSLQLFKNFDRYKTLTLVAFFVVFLLSSVLFISSSVKYSLNRAIELEPDFIIQRLIGGQSVTTPINWQEKLIDIAGVSKVTPRVYGRYYFDEKKSALIIGIDFFDEQSSKALEKITKNIDLKSFLQGQKMIIGKGVAKYLNSHFYTDFYNFLTPNGDFKKVKIFKVLNSNSALFSNDIVIMSIDLARDILGIKPNEISDFALEIPNESEENTIKSKIESLFFNVRVVTKKQMKQAYESLYDYKGGLFLVLYLIVFFTFSLILYLRYLISTSIEKREIGILRAIGWSIKDILKLKFYENLTIVFSSYALGVIVAYIYVYIFNAPILRDIFLGSDNLNNNVYFVANIDFGLLATIFIIYAVTFLASVLIPIWRIAITNPKEAMQ